MTFVCVRPPMVPPQGIEARAVIVGVAPVIVALSVRRSADLDSETWSLQVDSLRQGSRRAGPHNRADHAGGDHQCAQRSHNDSPFLFRLFLTEALRSKAVVVANLFSSYRVSPIPALVLREFRRIL